MSVSVMMKQVSVYYVGIYKHGKGLKKKLAYCEKDRSVFYLLIIPKL